MQLISRTPAATRTFADIDTFGPICSQKKIKKFRGSNGKQAENKKTITEIKVLYELRASQKVLVAHLYISNLCRINQFM